MANNAMFQQQFRLGQLLLLTLLLSFFALVAMQPSYAQEAPQSATNQSNPVLIHPASQEFPAVAGQRVVWQDARFGPTDIFMRDLTAATVVNLTKSTTWEVQPAIEGDTVVWKDGYAGIGIHGLNLAASTTFTVTSGHRDTSRPRLSGGVVVWADNRAGDQDWNIYAYDIAKATESAVSTAPGNQMDPQIDWPWVVWWDNQERIYLYNLESKTQQTVLATGGARFPDVSAADQVVIWQDIRHGNWDLYGYNIAQQREIPVLVKPLDQERAAIDEGVVAVQSRTPGSAWNIALLDLATGNFFAIDPQASNQTEPALEHRQVVWQDMRQHTVDIYAFAWNGELIVNGASELGAPAYLQAGAFPGGEIQLQWDDQADNEEGFVIERAQGITGTQWSEVVQLPANQTTYVDHIGQGGDSYWYRVRARLGGTYSLYSNESFATTFTETPTLYELYLMTLINAARAEPAAFGYPEMQPVPPLVYNPLVAYSAHSHSQAILNSGFQFGHCDPIGRCPTERARAVGYPGSCAENLTTTFRTGPAAIADANQGFLDSQGHRENMLAADLTEMGVGHTYDSRKGDAYRHGQITEVFCGNTTMIRPALPMGAMVPPMGDTTTSFTYLVNFYSATGRPPTAAQVMIDGQPHPMRVKFGTASHGTYEAVQQLPAGQHEFYFAFTLADGQPVRWPPTSVIPYPVVVAPSNLPPAPEEQPAPLPTFRYSLYLPYTDR